MSKFKVKGYYTKLEIHNIKKARLFDNKVDMWQHWPTLQLMFQTAPPLQIGELQLHIGIAWLFNPGWMMADKS